MFGLSGDDQCGLKIAACSATAVIGIIYWCFGFETGNC
jgi:hypothetical protein